MPLAEWFLTTWEQRQRVPVQSAILVQIDPSAITGERGTFGPALFLPYTVPPYSPPGQPETPVALQLLSLEGWLGWNQERDSAARLRIPTQTLWPGQTSLQVPMTDELIETIEHARAGGAVNLSIMLSGQAVVPLHFPPPASPRASGSAAPTSTSDPRWVSVVPVQNTSTTSLTIEREHWLRILQQLGAGTRRLVELPEPRLPRQDPRWAECLRLLEAATQYYRSGAYEQAMITCRQITEGIPHVLCNAWGLPKQQNGQPSFEQWLKAIEGRLTAAWPKDTLTPGMLYTLLSGAWKWSAPAPHYGTDMPVREETAFALGLMTDLLLFSAQALQAHPQPVVAAP